jgi:hypothetical protein
MPCVEAQLHQRLIEVRDVLMYSFDLEVLVEPLAPELYRLPSPWLPAFDVVGAEYSIVGRDATGGVYIICEDTQGRPLCHHIDTQGHAVLLGNDFAQMVSLILELPYFREVLMQARELTTAAFKSAAGSLELEILDELPALAAAREDLLATLSLPRLDDAVEYLHRWTTEPSPIRIVSPHGWEYESLIPYSSPQVSSET